MRRAVYAGAGLVAAALAVTIVLLIGSGSSGAGTITVAGKRLPATARYGHPPGWLSIPEPSAPTTPVATPARPQLRAMQGYAVKATLATGTSVLYSAEGPAVPSWVARDAGSGHWQQGETAPSTFQVSFKNVKGGSVPVSAADFSVITYTGQLLRPKLTNADGGQVPSSLRPGQTLKLNMKTSLPEGDGEIRWAPDGKRILVSYVWTLEFD